jgi:hypothetical protein
MVCCPGAVICTCHLDVDDMLFALGVNALRALKLSMVV